MSLLRKYFSRILILNLVLMCETPLLAADLGVFEGAVWRFKLEPKNPQLQTLRGMFRVHNGVLYQKDKPQDKADKVVGTETLVQRKGPNGEKRTKLIFTDLRAIAQKRGADRNRDFTHGLQGTVFMRQE